MSLTDAWFRGKTAAERDAAARLVLVLWRSVAGGFREDERTVEAQRFAEVSAALGGEVTDLADDAVPTAELCRRMLEILAVMVPERVADLHARIDELAAMYRAKERELHVLQLAASWQTDELERSRTMLTQALRGRETVQPTSGTDGTAPLVSQLLATLLDISAPPPRPEASRGRRASDAGTTTTTSISGRVIPVSLDPKAGERAVIVQVLKEVLDGTAQAPRLIRALEDAELAKRLADLAAEHRTYRGILQQIGVLPKG